MKNQIKILNKFDFFLQNEWEELQKFEHKFFQTYDGKNIGAKNVETMLRTYHFVL